MHNILCDGYVKIITPMDPLSPENIKNNVSALVCVCVCVCVCVRERERERERERNRKGESEKGDRGAFPTSTSRSNNIHHRSQNNVKLNYCFYAV